MKFTLILLFFFFASCFGMSKNPLNEGELQVELEALINEALSSCRTRYNVSISQGTLSIQNLPPFTLLEAEVSDMNKGSPQPEQPEPEKPTEPTDPQTVGVAEVLVSKAGKRLVRVLSNLKKKFMKKADRLAAKAGDMADVPEAAQDMQELQQAFSTAATKMTTILSDMTAFFNKADMDMKEILQILPKKAKKNVIRKIRFHFGKKTLRPRGNPLSVSK